MAHSEIAPSPLSQKKIPFKKRRKYVSKLSLPCVASSVLQKLSSSKGAKEIPKDIPIKNEELSPKKLKISNYGNFS